MLALLNPCPTGASSITVSVFSRIERMEMSKEVYQRFNQDCVSSVIWCNKQPPIPIYSVKILGYLRLKTVLTVLNSLCSLENLYGACARKIFLLGYSAFYIFFLFSLLDN